MYSVLLIHVSFVRQTKTSSCGLNYVHLLELTHGVFGDGPALQHRPLQHTLPGGQHFGALPVPQQLGVFGDGPALQHRPLQHTLPGGQHFGALPVPQQLWL